MKSDFFEGDCCIPITIRCFNDLHNALMYYGNDCSDSYDDNDDDDDDKEVDDKSDIFEKVSYIIFAPKSVVK